MTDIVPTASDAAAPPVAPVDFPEFSTGGQGDAALTALLRTTGAAMPDAVFDAVSGRSARGAHQDLERYAAACEAIYDWACNCKGCTDEARAATGGVLFWFVTGHFLALGKEIGDQPSRASGMIVELKRQAGVQVSAVQATRPAPLAPSEAAAGVPVRPPMHQVAKPDHHQVGGEMPHHEVARLAAPGQDQVRGQAVEPAACGGVEAKPQPVGVGDHMLVRDQDGGDGVGVARVGIMSDSWYAVPTAVSFGPSASSLSTEYISFSEVLVGSITGLTLRLLSSRPPCAGRPIPRTPPGLQPPASPARSRVRGRARSARWRA